MKKPPQDLYIITTAMKRDSCEWDSEISNYRMSTNSELNTLYPGQSIVVDSWNNIKKYADITGAFFIFDEDRVCGSGAVSYTHLYAEVSKGGAGLHLHYIYKGDVSKLSRIYDKDIEIKVFTGNSSLRICV